MSNQARNLRLRELIEQDALLVVPGVYDPYLAQFRHKASTIGQLARVLDFKAQNALVDLPGFSAAAARYKGE